MAELAGPVSELTDEHFRTLQEYHLLRDTFQQFCHAVVDLFASTREFYHAREKHSGMELNNIFRHLSFMNNRLTEMSHLVDTLLDKQGASQAIKVLFIPPRPLSTSPAFYIYLSLLSLGR